MHSKWRYLLLVWLIGTFGFLAYTAITRPADQRVVFDSQETVDKYLSSKGTGASLSFGSFANAIQTAREMLPNSILGVQDDTSKDTINPNTTVTGLHTIAVLGDSMIHTLGPDISILKSELEQIYPKADIVVVNAGNPGRDIEDGLARLINDYQLLGEKHLAVMAYNPNILIIESFAYNHWENTQSDLDRHWLTIANIIDTARSRKPDIHIVLAATIAPYCPTYTDGSANLPEDRKEAQCATVKKYLQNMVNFANSQNLPLVNAYHDSLEPTNGSIKIGESDGNPDYVADDNIHPSVEGGEFFARKVVEVLVGEGLLLE